MPNLGFRRFSRNSIFFAVAPIRCIGVPDLMSAEFHPHMSPAGIEHMIGGEASADARRRARPRNRAKARRGSVWLNNTGQGVLLQQCERVRNFRPLFVRFSNERRLFVLVLSVVLILFSSSSGSRGAIVFAADDAAGSILAF